MEMSKLVVTLNHSDDDDAEAIKITVMKNWKSMFYESANIYKLH